MDEKQKKQLEIIRKALTDGQREMLLDLSKKIKAVGKNVVKDLTAFDVIQGHSEKMMAANAIMQITRQLEVISSCQDD